MNTPENFCFQSERTNSSGNSQATCRGRKRWPRGPEPCIVEVKLQPKEMKELQTKKKRKKNILLQTPKYMP